MGKKPTLLISNLKPDAKKFTLAIINIILEDGEQKNTLDSKSKNLIWKISELDQ